MIAKIKNPETGKLDMVIIATADGGVQVGLSSWGKAPVQFASRAEAVAAIKKSCGVYQPTDNSNLIMVAE